MDMSREEVLHSLANLPVRDPDIWLQICGVINSPPFSLKYVQKAFLCAGVSLYFGDNWESLALTPGRRADTASLATRVIQQFDLLVSDFDRLMVAQSWRCERATDGTFTAYELDEPCHPKLDALARAIAPQLGLRYVDAFALHAMSLEFEELPKHNEFEFVARLDYSEPNAFSLLFYEWA